ncbi:MAG: hypothetical protein GWN35_03445 [Actinobacteria bacterium]|nr:hypothetical protein [Actinomycetota bacterium]
MPLHLQVDVLEVGEDLAGRIPVGDRQALPHDRLAVVALGQAVEVVAALHAGRRAGVVEADVPGVAAELVARPAERLVGRAVGGTDDAVEADLPGVATDRAVVAATFVLADREAEDLVDALLALAAAQATRSAGLVGGAVAGVHGAHVEATAVRRLPVPTDALDAELPVVAVAGGVAGRAAAVATIAGDEQRQE